MSIAQLFYLLGHMQKLVLQAPDVARSLLIENPQLTYALLHAQFITGMIDEPFLPLSSEDLMRSERIRKEREAQISFCSPDSDIPGGKTDTYEDRGAKRSKRIPQSDNIASTRSSEKQLRPFGDTESCLGETGNIATSQIEDPEASTSHDVLIEHLLQNDGVIQQIISVDPDNVEGWNDAERAQIRQIQMELKKRGLM